MCSSPVRADLHIHLGRAPDGRPVKVPASPALTLARIPAFAQEAKGLDVVGIVDFQVPSVRRRLRELELAGEVSLSPGGGYRWPPGVLVVPGCELAVAGPKGPVHLVVYFPDAGSLGDFAAWLGPHLTHLEYSSQPCRAPAPAVAAAVHERGGLVVPAHVFTPFRGLYASADRLEELFADATPLVGAVELGLSADTCLADRLPELRRLPFVTASDAHSLERIGRELLVAQTVGPGWQGLAAAIKGEEGALVANYGLDPRLGKYHRSFCPACGRLDGEPPVLGCPAGHPVVKGVLDRIFELGAGPCVHPPGRPPYYHQIPLVDLPGLGPAALVRLRRLGHDFYTMHQAGPGELVEAVGPRTAALVLAARRGGLEVTPGGGGHYGRVRTKDEPGIGRGSRT